MSTVGLFAPLWTLFIFLVSFAGLWNHRRLSRRQPEQAASTQAGETSWDTYVEPGMTGPEQPEGEFKILVAEKRREQGANGVEIRFQAALYCYFTSHGVVRVGAREYPHEAGWARIGTAAETSADLIAQEKERLRSEMEKAKTDFGETLEQLNQRWRLGEFSGSLEGKERYEQERKKAQDLCAERLSSCAVRWNELSERAHNTQWKIAPDLPEEVWPATKPIDELASVWADYREKIREINAAQWREQAAAREQGKMLEVAAREREQELEAQRQIADLLPGPTVDGSSAPVSASN